VREILSETTARHAKQAIIDVAANVELSAYETPSFHDRLVRASAGEHRPIQMVDGLIGTIGASPPSPALSSRCWPSSRGWCRCCCSPGSRCWRGDEGRAGHLRLPHAHDLGDPRPQLPVPAVDREGPGESACCGSTAITSTDQPAAAACC